MRLLTSAVAVPALTVAAVLTPLSHAAGPQVPCTVFDHGPAQSAKPVSVCAGYRGSRLVVSLSTDRGRTWRETASTGTPEPVDHLFSILVSPSYHDDQTVYLHYQSLGLFASTDGGRTFVLVDPQAGMEIPDRISAVDAFGPAVPGVAGQPAVAVPGQGPAAFYRGQHIPVAGSGNQQDRGFYQLGHGSGAVVLNASQGPDERFVRHARLARCTAELICAGGQTLPAGVRFLDLAVDPAATATTAVALTEIDHLAPALWVTADQGRTFVRSTGFDRAMVPYLKGVRNVWIDSVAVLPGGKTWLTGFSTTRGSYLLMTTDGGRTWARRTYPGYGNRIVGSRDGRLFGSGKVFRCSLDRGRTWSFRCPR